MLAFSYVVHLCIVYRNRHAATKVIAEAVVKVEVKGVGEEIESAASLVAAVTELELGALAGGHPGPLQPSILRVQSQTTAPESSTARPSG